MIAIFIVINKEEMKNLSQTERYLYRALKNSTCTIRKIFMDPSDKIKTNGLFVTLAMSLPVT